jgi:hypothetical protein
MLIELIGACTVFMVRGCCGVRRWGIREGGVTPPVASAPEGSNPPGRRASSWTGTNSSW